MSGCSAASLLLAITLWLPFGTGVACPRRCIEALGRRLEEKGIDKPAVQEWIECVSQVCETAHPSFGFLDYLGIDRVSSAAANIPPLGSWLLSSIVRRHSTFDCSEV